MPRKRRSPTLTEKLAAAYLTWGKRGNGEPLMSRAEAAGLTPAEIVKRCGSLVRYAHGRADALDGPMHPSNLWVTPVEVDAIETPRDISNIAKAKRQAPIQREHKRRMAAKYALPIDVTGGRDDMRTEAGCRSGCTMSRCAYTRDGSCVRLKSKKRKARPMAGGKQSKWKRTMRGQWVPR